MVVVVDTERGTGSNEPRVGRGSSNGKGSPRGRRCAPFFFVAASGRRYSRSEGVNRAG